MSDVLKDFIIYGIFSLGILLLGNAIPALFLTGFAYHFLCIWYIRYYKIPKKEIGEFAKSKEKSRYWQIDADNLIWQAKGVSLKIITLRVIIVFLIYSIFILPYSLIIAAGIFYQDIARIFVGSVGISPHLWSIVFSFKNARQLYHYRKIK